MLEWNNLLIDCSSHRDEHSSNWNIWYTSTSSRDNRVTRSQKVYISNRCFRILVTITRDPCKLRWNTLLIELATITRNPGKLEWNTLLIDYSSNRDEHSSNWHIWYTSTSSRDNRVTRSQKVYISNRCFRILATITRDPCKLRWNTLLIDCSSHRYEHSSNWHIWYTSTSSRDNWVTRSQRYKSQTWVLEY